MLIDGKTGQILWTLGGKRNGFVELEPAAGPDGADAPAAPALSFSWQHHARFVPGTDETEMTLFDNHVKATTHGACRAASCSRGLRIAVDAAASPRAVRLLREYHHPSRLQAQSQGSVQALSSSSPPPPTTPAGGGDGEGEGEGQGQGNVFIGWGRCPSFTEHTASGDVVMDVQFSPWHSDAIPDALDNYRAYKMDWVATPWWDPAVALRGTPSEGELAVYVSWNGATEVREWVVRGADGEGEGGILAVSMRTGFETRLTVRMGGLRRLWAEALDKEGNVLRSSEVMDLGDGDLVLKAESEESEDADWISPAVVKNTGWSASTWAWLIGGVIGLALTIMAGVFVWRRKDYNRLDNDDLDSDTDSDGSSVFGLDAYTQHIPEAYEDWNSGPRLGT